MALYNTEQEAFNQMVRGLASQNWQTENNVCKYRQNQEASCPIRCAIGHLIPDDKYEKRWDDKVLVAGAILDSLIEKEILSTSISADFLNNAQAAHDYTMDGWHRPAEFQQLAEDFDLDWPEDVPQEGAL